MACRAQGSAPVESVSFVLNGQPVVVQGANPLLSLNEWLRAQPQLGGTKIMCGEGGCGVCVVTVARPDPVNKKEINIAVNSCLCPLLSVEGWKITTVEGLGNSKVGYNSIQSKLVQYNGSQCGYCTPGMVMSMYSLLQTTPKPTKQQVEDLFDGNICRCTGYRPILDAMKTFATDPSLVEKSAVIPDLEELSVPNKCCFTCRQCVNYNGGILWYRPSDLSEVFEIFQTHSDMNVKLIAGDTGKGVFKNPEKIDAFVDLKGVASLSSVEVHDSYLKIGSTITIANLIDLLETYKDHSPNTFEQLAFHLCKIASTPVRNVASWAGNLMLTHNNANFPSDVSTIMTAVGATVTVHTWTKSPTGCNSENELCRTLACVGRTILGIPSDDSIFVGEYPIPDFLQLDMTNSVIVSMQIPFASKQTVFRSYKIMPRAQNAHAIVNAAFCMEVDPVTLQVLSIPMFAYGGIDAHVISAKNTESFLTKKFLHDPATLRGAVEALSNEINPSVFPACDSTQYRTNLALNLFYKFYLSALGKNVSSQVQSAAVRYIRPVSTGYQSYGTSPSEYPITQPTTKITALQQASGEAEYTTDLPPLPAELSAAFVLTSVANAKITGIDTDAAMAMPGAVKILTAEDIPSAGKNNFTNWNGLKPEEVLVQDVSQYAGQAVALVLADTQQNANRIAQAVIVSYQSLGKPILTISDAITINSFFDSPDASNVMKAGNAEDAISKADHVVNDDVSCESQYHFTMETQTSLCVPVDDGYTVYSSTQWPQLTQIAVATLLGVSSNCINVSVKRVGGGYGAKLTRSQQIAAACALGCYCTRRPVRMHMDIDTNMKTVGKRYPFYATYKVGCTMSGILNGLEINLYNDPGYIDNDNSMTDPAMLLIDNVYKCANWTVTPKSCKTHNSPNTYCRSPGSAPAIFIMESIMTRVAESLGLDVEQVKRANLYQQGDVSPTEDPKKGGMPLKYCNIQTLWDDLTLSADVNNRKSTIEQFNKNNRWRKRGLSMVPLKFGIEWSSFPFSVLVSVYASDGSVAVVHSGVEIGQGINTKVSQVVAKTLGVPLNLVKVKPTNVVIGPNSSQTSGSITSELNCKGALMACTALKARIDAVKQKMNGTPTWQEVVMKCYTQGVDLSEKYFVCEHTDYTMAYNSYGVTCAEVEIDVLTGSTEILRVDMLYDCGESINPEIDIGQAEGAFVMGLGYWLTEKLKYDADTGALLTHNTWEYKPPSSKDIPIDFRVSLLKNAPNPLGVLRSKAVGEPPLCMSCSALFAIKKAIQSARAGAGDTSLFTLPGPATVEIIQLYCLVSPSHYTL